MALTVKADAQDLPSIFQILGLGGPPPTDGQAPPIDSSLAGAPDAPEPATEQKAVPTKLGRLNQIIAASQGAADHPLMTDEHSSPDVPAQPRSLTDIIGANGPDPSQLVAAAQGNNTFPAAAPDAVPATSASSTPAATTAQKSWAQTHPTLMRILKGAATTAEGGAAGTGAITFGEGFQRAHELTDPIRKEMEHAALAEKAATTAHTKAATEQMQSQVTLPNGLTVPFALAQKLYPTLTTEHGKDARNQANIDSREGIAGDKNAIALRKQGLKLDANGKQVPLTRDEMSETEQASLDLKQSQEDLATARAAVERAKNDPNSPAYKAAIGRLEVARKNAQTAAGRLGLGRDTFNANYFGTGPTGEALPGVALTDNGTPVGVRVSNVTKQTNVTRSKAEQAGVIKQQGEDILKQIDAHPDIYGVVAGRWNEFNAGKFGAASQDVRDAYTSLKSFAALQPALHGARGIGMMKEFEDAVGSMGNDPEGLKGSINSLLRTATAFQKAGTMKTAPGGGSHPSATHVYDPSSGKIVPVK